MVIWTISWPFGLVVDILQITCPSFVELCNWWRYFELSKWYLASWSTCWLCAVVQLMVVASGRRWLANASPPPPVSITPWFINMSDVGEEKAHQLHQPLLYQDVRALRSSMKISPLFINPCVAHMDHTQREHDQPRSLSDGPNLTTASK